MLPFSDLHSVEGEGLAALWDDLAAGAGKAVAEAMGTTVGNALGIAGVGMAVAWLTPLKVMVRERLGIRLDASEKSLSLLKQKLKEDPEFARAVAELIVTGRDAAADGSWRPSPPAFFVDRDAERRRVARRDPEPGGAAQPGVRLIVGRSGSGCTALAEQMAHELYPDFPDGYAYLDCDEWRRADALDFSGAKRSVLHQLGVHVADLSESELDSQYLHSLVQRKFLLVVENVQGRVEAGGLVRRWPVSLVLVTTRRLSSDLRDWSEEPPIELRGLDAAGAWDLLARRCGDPAMLERERWAAEALLEWCDRMPFPIRLLGVRLSRRRGDVDAVASVLADIQAVSGQDEIAERCLDRSFAQLSTAAKWGASMLLAHPGRDFTRDSARALLGIAGNDIVDELVDSCLVVDNGGRLAFYQLVRNYAKGRLPEATAGLDRGAFERLLNYYADRVVAADARARGGQVRYRPRPGVRWPFSNTTPSEWLAANREVLFDLLQHARLRGYHDEVGQLCGGFEALLLHRTYYSLCLAAIEEGILSAEEAGERRLLARLLAVCGRILILMHQFDEARRVLDSAEEALGGEDDLPLRSSILEYRGRLAEEQADRDSTAESAELGWVAARESFLRCVAIDRRIPGALKALGLHQRMLANVLIKLGESELALAPLAESLEIATSQGDRRNIGRVRMVLAKAYTALDDLAAARAALGDARRWILPDRSESIDAEPASVGVGHPGVSSSPYESELAEIEGDIAYRAGDWETARRHWGSALRRHFADGHPRFDTFLTKMGSLPPPPL